MFCSGRCHYAGRATGATVRVVTRPYNVSDAGRAAWKVGAQKTRTIRIAKGNYAHTDASRAKLSIAAANQLARAKGEFASSKIEHLVADRFTALGISFERQVAIRDTSGRFAAVIDLVLAGRVAVEVNGTYWHCDPRSYPNGPINEIQARAVARYERKRSLLAIAGYVLIEIWEADLRKDAVSAIDVAIAEARLSQRSLFSA